MSWMQSLADSLPICEISIPGTHNSAAWQYVTTPWSCHYTSVTNQLRAGVRLLDIRIKVQPSGSDFTFVTCHGNWSGSEYQSFVSAMDECAAFLIKNPREFIAMSLQVDDWNGVTASDWSSALDALTAVLEGYAIYNTNLGAMPVLGAVRGKIYLVNRIAEAQNTTKLGVPVYWKDNTPGSDACPNIRRKFDVFVQDQWTDLGLTPRATKLNLFTKAMNQRRKNQLLLNFASGTTGGGPFGVDIIHDLLAQIGKQPARGRPATWGWALFDFESIKLQTRPYGGMTCVDLIIDANTGYSRYPEQFTVYPNDL
jgi:1-phosphatidylinositol phosphodiesterase